MSVLKTMVDVNMTVSRFVYFMWNILLTGSCPTGYITDDFDCIDENECVANNGHGPCQDTCTNTEGSFHCSCEGLPGTRLASDQKTCEEIDLCEQNNGGCSHDCHTSYGQVSSITTSNV